MPADLAAPTEHQFSVRGITLHFAEWGAADASPLLLLHGGLDHCRTWDWVANDLARDWRVIAPDMRGHGDSDWSPDADYTVLAHLFDLTELIRSHNLAPVTIIAHSMGANLALRYAGILPETVRKLVAIEGVKPTVETLDRAPQRFGERLQAYLEARLKAPPGSRRIGVRLRAWFEEQRMLGELPTKPYASLDDVTARLLDDPDKRLTRLQAEHLAIHGTKRNADGTYNWKFDNYIRNPLAIDMPDSEIEELWSGITCPTLIMNGSLGFASNPLEDHRAPLFPTAKSVTIEGAGHWIYHNKLAEFLAAVRAFI